MFFGGQPLRQFALNLLDDEHGINVKAYDTIHQLLDDDDHEDIINAIDATEGRYYIDGPVAEMLREKKIDEDD